MGSLWQLSTLATLAAGLFHLAAAESLYSSGGVTILSRNDLDGAQNDGSAAILVSQTSPYEGGRTACTLLNEVPWSPEEAGSKDTLRQSLTYQEYQGLASPKQIYWISKAKAADNTCRAIDSRGKIHKVNCREQLPTLCTQSADTSSSRLDDNSARWQVQQRVGSKVLTGYRDHHVWKFRGIRYADKAERFNYARTASFEDPGEVDATTAGADCSQPIEEVTSGSSEDCLFANVWTPYLPSTGDKGKKPKLKPVMMYIFGGGFTIGSGKNPNTDGTNLASRGDVVVVSINYRLGSIGFLNLNDGVHNGNYGISDMVAGLEWVNKYIKYFGGDPDNVTIFGYSAGAVSTHTLLSMPKAKGLFHRAAMQSPPVGVPSNGRPVAYYYHDDLETNYQITTKNVLEQAGCLNATDKVACLGRLDGFELVNLPTNAFAPVVDGEYITTPHLIVNQTSLSLATNIPVLVGINRDETGIYIPTPPTPNDTFPSFLDSTARSFGLPPNTSALLNLTTHPFPGLPPSLFNNTATPAEILNATIRLSTDAFFTCYSLAAAHSAAKHSAFKQTYYYVLNRTYQLPNWTLPWCDPPKTDSHPYGDPEQEYFKCHSGEQMVVFGTAVGRAGLPDRDGGDVRFLRLMVDYWAAFARWGDPNPEKGWLKARGYGGTLEEVERVGRWEAVGRDGDGGMRVLQLGGRQVALGEGHREICGGLGVGLDALEG